MLDLSVLTTESRNMNTLELDKMSAMEIVSIMNAEDKKVPEAVQKALPQIATAVELASEALLGGGRIIYVGAGTSGRLGVLDAVECEPTFGVSRDQVIALIAGGAEAFISAAEGSEDDEQAGVADLEKAVLSPYDLVIGVAASGRTPYVCSALKFARGKGCHTVAVTCNKKSLMGSIAELAIEAVVGPEVVTGSTRLKAGSAQKMILNMISTAAMVLCGRVYENLMIDVVHTNEKLRIRAINVVMQAAGVTAERAERTLLEAGGNAKVAVTMLLAGLSAEDAAARLSESGGHVRLAIQGKRPAGDKEKT